MADPEDIPNNRGPHGMASQRYAQGKSIRDPYLQRARQNAALTIPWLFREEGTDGSTQQEIPWNSGGAYMLANMSAKLVLALFGIGQAPMKLKPGKDTQAALIEMAQDDPDAAGDLAASIDLGLSGVETEFVECMDEDGDRAKLAMCCMKLLCGGNHALIFSDDGTLRGVSLERFVTWRDPSGNLLEFVIEDSLSYETLPEDVRQAVDNLGYKQGTEPNEGNTPVLVYTRGFLRDGRWKLSQEVYGQVVPGSQFERAPEALNFFFPGWNFVDGEHYARSYVEHYLGDLQTIEGIAQTVQEGAAAVARLLTLIAPGGVTSKKAFAEAQNGDVITGRAEDVHVVQNNKGGDYQAVMGISEKAERRLAAAFLMNSSVQRQGERVTAEEIRFVAGELEDAQAGAYSQQVVTLQNPYARLKLFYLMKNRRVTPLPMNSVKVTVIGGVGGLARNQELIALDTFADGLLQRFGPQAAEYINLTVYLKRRAAALGVKLDGLVYSEAKMEEKRQEAQQQQLVQSLGPEALKQVGSNITSNQVADTQAASRQLALPAPTTEG